MHLDPATKLMYVALALVVTGGVLAVWLVRGPVWALMLAAGFTWALKPIWSSR